MKFERRKKDLPKIYGMEKWSNLRTDAEFICNDFEKKEKQLFTNLLKIVAEPPIKGEVTIGKTRWRGIKLIRHHVAFDTYSWLEQRGKQITPKIIVKTSKKTIF